MDLACDLNIIHFIYLLQFHAPGSAVIGGERTGSPAFAEAGSRYRNSRTMADRVYVRKCAHFIEYTGLGILLRQSALCVRVNGAILEEMWTEDPADGKDRTGRMRAMAPCGSVWLEIHRIAIFAVPFLDETIQLFTEGRSGQISDVWLDMAGALTGTLLYLAAGQIYLRIKKNENG